MSCKLQTYASVLLLAIDGQLQLQEQAIEISHDIHGPVTVRCRSAVPSGGFEFDPRAEAEMPLEKRRRFDLTVIVGVHQSVLDDKWRGDPVIRMRDMVVSGYSVSGDAVRSDEEQVIRGKLPRRELRIVTTFEQAPEKPSDDEAP